jgi:hypothetical protein
MEQSVQPLKPFETEMEDHITEVEIHAMEQHEAHIEEHRLSHVSPATHKIATEFVDALQNLFEPLEELAHSRQPMTEGEWLKISNLFGVLHKYKESLEKTQIVIESRRHARAAIARRVKLSKSEKLQDPLFTMCPRCKRVMTKKYLRSKQHRDGDICRHIRDYGHVVGKNSARKKENHAPRVTISKTPIFGGYSIADRCLLLSDEKLVRPTGDTNDSAALPWRRSVDGKWVL